MQSNDQWPSPNEFPRFDQIPEEVRSEEESKIVAYVIVDPTIYGGVEAVIFTLEQIAPQLERFQTLGDWAEEYHAKPLTQAEYLALRQLIFTSYKC